VSCHVTIPAARFVPPRPFAAQPPAEYHERWYGTTDLWTALDPAGEVWWALPRDQYGLSQKTAWYSRAFSVMKEPQPAITVRGRRLDIAGPTFTAGGPGTNAIDASGEWMLVGLSLPTPGCWEITGQYQSHTLRYAVWVADDYTRRLRGIPYLMGEPSRCS